MQRTPTVSEADVKRILNRDYPADSRDEILRLIDAVIARVQPRVVLACLKLGGGDPVRVKQELNDAPGYWREIISDAEYPLATRKWHNLESESEDVRQRVYDADWKQYSDWLNRP